MFVIALVLVALAVASVVLVLTGSVGGVRIDVANFQLTTSSAQMFLAGAVTTIALAAGIVLLTVAARRARRRRREALDHPDGAPGADQAGFTAGADRG